MRLTFFSLVFVMALTGCMWDPDFMPAGYTYHQMAYKAPPGPKAKDIGYRYSAAENEAVMTTWRYALRDLLLKAKADGLVIPEPVILKTDLRQNAFEGTYDSLLREGLRAYGYRLADQTAQNGGQYLFYSAYDPAEQGNVKRDPAILYNDEMPSPHKNRQFTPPHKGMMLVIGLVKDGHWLKKVSGLYDVPLYGYQPGGYLSGQDNPVKPEPVSRAGLPTSNTVNP